MFIPELKLGMTVIWNNAIFHKSPRIQEAFHAAGIHLLFLPPYSPDFNPIEPFWARLKANIRRITTSYSPISQALDKVFACF